MITWLLRNKAIISIYIFYSPWILISLVPLTPVYGDISMILIPVFLILWIQTIFFYIFTTLLCRRLILYDRGNYTSISVFSFQLHSWINLALISLFFSILIFGEIQGSNMGVTIFIMMIFSISELVRSASLSKLIVSMEIDGPVELRDYFLTLLMVINPLIGLWNIHARVKKLLSIS